MDRDFGYITTEEQAKAFDAVLKERLCPFLVLFYADWCGHCQTYKPMWGNFGNLAGRNVPMAAIQDTQKENVSSMKDATLEGFPTVVLFAKDGSMKTISSDDMRSEEKMKQLLIVDDGNPIRTLMVGGARMLSSLGQSGGPPDLGRSGGPVRRFIRSIKSRPLYPRKRPGSRKNPKTRKAKRHGRTLH
jgi:thiol-disulfide isomerase/thioredoxin